MTRNGITYKKAGFISVLVFPCAAMAAIPTVELPTCTRIDITNSQKPADMTLKQRLAFDSVLSTAGSWPEAVLRTPPEGYYTRLIPIRRALEKNGNEGRLVPQQPKWTMLFTCRPSPRAGVDIFCSGWASGDPDYLVGIVPKQSGGTWSCTAWTTTVDAANRALGVNRRHTEEVAEIIKKHVVAVPQSKMSDLSAANSYRIWAEKNPCLWNDRMAYTSPECGATNAGSLTARKKGSDPIGAWISQNMTLQITKSGDLFKVVSANAISGVLNGTYVGKLSGGKIDLSVPICGPLTYAKDSDQIYFCGEELSRK